MSEERGEQVKYIFRPLTADEGAKHFADKLARARAHIEALELPTEYIDPLIEFTSREGKDLTNT